MVLVSVRSMEIGFGLLTVAQTETVVSFCHSKRSISPTHTQVVEAGLGNGLFPTTLTTWWEHTPSVSVWRHPHLTSRLSST